MFSVFMFFKIFSHMSVFAQSVNVTIESEVFRGVSLVIDFVADDEDPPACAYLSHNRKLYKPYSWFD